MAESINPNTYTVTATRKRPPSFQQLAGQEFAVASLGKSAAAGRIAPAYLFSGPRGVGKTSAARILAKAINCEKAPTPDGNPCGVCNNCLAIAKGNSLDVIEIDGASNTSVNDVREIRDEVLFAPSSFRYKVYIIDEVHMLSNSAFNALLKTIEEPPPYVVFIFATTEIHKVPATIKSRCQQFNFRLIGLDIIKEKLAEAAAESGIEAENEAILWIAKESTGSMRDAYTLFDQAAAFSDGKITIEKIKEKLGLVGLDDMNNLAECFADGSVADSIRTAGDLLAKGIAPEQFVIELSEYFRNILLIKHEIRKESILGSPAERYSEKVINKFSSSQIEYALSILLDLYRNMRYSLSQQFEIELVVSRFSFLDKYLSSTEILDSIKKIKEEIRRIPTRREETLQEGDVVLSSADKSGEKNKQEEIENFTPYRDSISAKIKPINIIFAASLAKTGLWERKGNNVKIHCSEKFIADTLKHELSLLKKELDAEAGGNFKIDIVFSLPKAEEPLAVGGDRQSATDRDVEVAAKERIDLVKRVFRGEIVETRKIEEKEDEY